MEELDDASGATENKECHVWEVFPGREEEGCTPSYNRGKRALLECVRECYVPVGLNPLHTQFFENASERNVHLDVALPDLNVSRKPLLGMGITTREFQEHPGPICINIPSELVTETFFRWVQRKHRRVVAHFLMRREREHLRRSTASHQRFYKERASALIAERRRLLEETVKWLENDGGL